MRLDLARAGMYKGVGGHRSPPPGDIMARLKRVADFEIAVPDRPGELARFLAKTRAAKVNLRAVWGFGIGQDNAEIICVPEKPENFRAFAQAEGLSVKQRFAVFMTGPDKLGALVDTLERVAAAGLNIHAFDAVAIGGKYAAYVWAGDDAGREALARLLAV